ncbi:DUF624 domain-containing protein [Lachnospiraceae bacterium WCA-9-b2]|jgi:uncharacterized membrane protein YesL|uniref:DUF624 domain-containing protein n=1 Tax=Sporofaciens musculi TaxID=2681861 RepID=A0A7X3MKQ8_9FIRM|nr:DUF624 domain-containing protein [Sporofaciens musculi]MCI9421741.1 DUF624 domain-containing protein [Dorea sp.]MXP78134.1 DUF624 domain-containing protein [Sporofaciens musculi]
MEELFNIEKVLGFCEKVCYFFIVNVLFVISNIPVLLFLLFVGAGQIRECLPLFLVCLIPMAPALSAVMYAMNRLIQGVEGNALRDYKKGYVRDFLQKAELGAGQMLVLLMCWTNIEFFTVQLRCLPLAVLFILLFAVSVLATPNLYMLASRYEMGKVQIAKTAVTLLFVKPVFTLGNIVAFFLILASFEISAGTTVLFMGSAYGFLVMFMNQTVMRQLENM